MYGYPLERSFLIRGEDAASDLADKSAKALNQPAVWEALRVLCNTQRLEHETKRNSEVV
jgi:hypothetical protein